MKFLVSGTDELSEGARCLLEGVLLHKRHVCRCSLQLERQRRSVSSWSVLVSSCAGADSRISNPLFRATSKVGECGQECVKSICRLSLSQHSATGKG